MPEKFEGTTPPQEGIENEPKLLDPEKVEKFISEVIDILYAGKRRGITQEELQDVVDRTMEKLLSTYDLEKPGDRFKTENY